MATKKKAVKTVSKSKSVVSKSPSTALTVPGDFLAELRKDAVGYAASVKVQGEGNFISVKGGVFSRRGDSWGNSFEGVILAHAHVNEYYEGTYDPNKKGVTPSCYALSTNGDDMTPHASIAQPENDKCDTCPMAEIGSATVGKGRACKQKARLALIHGDDLRNAETASEALILQMAVPPMSKSNFTSYVKVIAENPKFGLPPYAVLVEFVLKPHPVYQYQLEFKPIAVINNEAILRVLQARARGEATDRVMAPFMKSAAKDDDKGKGRAKSKALPAPTKKKAATATRGRSRFG